MIVIKNSSGKSNEETRAVVARKENFIYQPFGLCSYNDTDMLCDFYAVENKHWKQPHDNSTWQQKQLFFGTFCTVFIMLLVWMDRQLDFQKNVTIKFLEIARYFFHWYHFKYQ